MSVYFYMQYNCIATVIQQDNRDLEFYFILFIYFNLKKGPGKSYWDRFLGTKIERILYYIIFEPGLYKNAL